MGETGTTITGPRLASLALQGHEAGLDVFRQALERGCMPHAWLITGPPGIGKATFAFALGRLLLGATQADSPAGRRVSAATHADLLVVERGFDEKRQRYRSEIVADDVRPINAFLRRTAAEGGWRVVIVDGAEWMNRSAANALLKILEEPPPATILLLTSSAPGRLLPTIRSRCRRLALGGLDARTMGAVLRTIAPEADPAELERVTALAHGAPAAHLPCWPIRRVKSPVVSSACVQVSVHWKVMKSRKWFCARNMVSICFSACYQIGFRRWPDRPR